jgi:hypothetical protein
MDLKELFEFAREKSADLFRETGDVSPLWHAITGDNEHALIATPWTSDDEKDATLQDIRRLFAEYNVKRYAFICEAWTYATRDKWEATHGVRPSEHPDRREVLRIHAEDRDGSTLSGMYYILRPEHGPAKLSPFQQDDASIVQVGRMAGMLM